MFVPSLRFSPARVVGLWLAVWLGAVAPVVFAQAGTPSANDGFDPHPNSIVSAMAVQADGKLIVGGPFTSFSPNNGTKGIDRAYLARINLDGTLDTAFVPAIGQTVSAVALQSDGKIVVASFTRPVDGSTFANGILTRLNTDGTTDATFSATVTSNTLASTRITSLLVQSDGKIVVGGLFKFVRPKGAADFLGRENLVRLNADGTLDSSFTAATNDIVATLALQADGKILVGGGFTKILNGTAETVRNRVARLTATGTVDLSFNPDANDLVSVITIGKDQKIYLGGSFTTLATAPDTTVGRLVRVSMTDGAVDTTFLPIMNGAVLALATESDGNLLAAGSFTSAAQSGSDYANTAARIARFQVDGSLDTTFLPFPDDDVTQLAVLPDSRIVIGGRFLSMNPSGVQGISRQFLARVLANGMPDTTFEPGYGTSYVNALPQGTDKILLTGQFSNVAGVTSNNIARIALDGTLDTSFKGNVNGRIAAAVLQSDGKIVIGGTFTKVGGVARNNIARLTANGDLDTTFDPNASSAVSALAVQSDGKILVGGDFIAFQPNGATATVSRYYVARLNTDGTVDTTFDPHANSSITGFALQADGKILIIGAFTTLQPGATGGGFSRTSLARLTSDGKVDEQFAVFPDQQVRAVAVQADGKILIGGSFTALIPSDSRTSTSRYYLARLEANGTFDTAFKSEVDNAVTTLAVQSDNKILVGGGFVQARKEHSIKVTSKDPVTGATKEEEVAAPWSKADRVVRFNADGTIDTAFTGGANWTVGRLVVQSNGRVVVIGAFTSLVSTTGGEPVYTPALGRFLADGTVDTSLSVRLGAATGDVRAIAQQTDGRVLLGGSFAGLAGSESANLVRVRTNGTADVTFNPQADGPVNSVVVLPPRDVDLALTRPFVYLGTNGQPFSTFTTSASLSMTGTISAVLVQADGKVLVGGSFQVTDGTTVLNNLVRFNANGSLDTAFAPNPIGIIYSLRQPSSDRLLVGGDFTNISGVDQSYLVRMTLDGALDSTFKPRPSADVRALHVQADGKIIVAGSFSTVQPGADTSVTGRQYIARFNTDGTLDTTYYPTANGPIYALAAQSDGKLVVGGSFTTFLPNGATTAVARQYVARLETTGLVDSAFDPKANGAVFALAAQTDGKIVIGGSFTTFEPNGATTVTARTYLARLETTGAVDATWVPAPDGFIYSLALNTDNSLYVGGGFSVIGGVTRNRVARLSAAGVVDSGFNPNANSSVSVIVVGPAGGVLLGGSFTAVSPYGSVIVGGSFKNIGGAIDNTAANLVRLNNDGNLDSTFLPKPDAAVNAVVRLADGRLLVAGAFTKIGTTVRNGLARLSADGVLDTAFNPNLTGAANALAVRPDGKILVGGDFTAVGGTARARLAQLNADGSLDTSFSADADAAVNAIALRPDGKILVGGAFTSLAGGGRNRIGLLSSAGALDGSFNPGANGTVNAIVARADGGFYVGGAFTTIAGSARDRVARFTSSAALDTTFTPGADGEVLALSIAPDGKLFAGGNFKVLGGQNRNLVGRVAVPEMSLNRVDYVAGAVRWSLGGAVPDPSAVYFEYSTDDRVWTSLGNATRSGSVWQLAGASLPTSKIVLLRARGTLLGSRFASSGFVEGRGNFYGLGLPTMTPPTALVGAIGSGFNFGTTGNANGATFIAAGLPAGLSIDPATGVISGTPTTAGTYSVLVTATVGSSSIGVTYTITVYASGSTSRLTALSCRAPVAGGSTVILGVALQGTGTKPVLVRTVGPTLGSLGISNAVAHPFLRLTRLDSSVLAANEVWGGSSTLSTLFDRVGVLPLPTGSADSAASADLGAGTATLFSGSATGETGVVLAELYDASASPLADTVKFLGLSVRGQVGTGDSILIAGVGVSGSTVKRLFVRGMGPTLGTFGVPGVVADPKIEVYRGVTLVASNDNWGTQVAVGGGYQIAPTPGEITTMTATLGLSALPAGSKDAVAVIDLPPGAYTMQVSGVGGLTGAALVEVYEAP